MDKKYIGIKEVALILSVSKQTIYRLVKSGDLKAYRFKSGNTLYFDYEDVIGALHPVAI